MQMKRSAFCDTHVSRSVANMQISQEDLTAGFKMMVATCKKPPQTYRELTSPASRGILVRRLQGRPRRYT